MHLLISVCVCVCVCVSVDILGRVNEVGSNEQCRSRLLKGFRSQKGLLVQKNLAVTLNTTTVSKY